MGVKLQVIKLLQAKLQIWIAVSSFAFSLLSCTTKHCRQDGTLIVVPKSPGHKIQQKLPQRAEDKQGDFPQLKKRVFVFKSDGSKQCEVKKAISLKEMAQQLKGIKIYSQENKKDNLIHIKVRGADTGRVNVYEIDREDLQKAQARGFKEWDFKP